MPEASVDVVGGAASHLQVLLVVEMTRQASACVVAPLPWPCMC